VQIELAQKLTRKDDRQKCQRPYDRAVFSRRRGSVETRRVENRRDELNGMEIDLIEIKREEERFLFAHCR
jgi:hypothetical protein